MAHSREREVLALMQWPPTADLMKTIEEMITSSPPPLLLLAGSHSAWLCLGSRAQGKSEEELLQTEKRGQSGDVEIVRVVSCDEVNKLL